MGLFLPVSFLLALLSVFVVGVVLVPAVYVYAAYDAAKAVGRREVSLSTTPVGR
jgi:hypothetical protein